MPKSTKTVFISKFVETKGVFALEVEYDPNKPDTVHNPRQNRDFHAPDWHETYADAVQAGKNSVTKMLREIGERRQRLEGQLALLERQS